MRPGYPPTASGYPGERTDARTWTFEARKRDWAFPETRKQPSLRRGNQLFIYLPGMSEATELGIFLEGLDPSDLQF